MFRRILSLMALAVLALPLSAHEWEGEGWRRERWEARHGRHEGEEYLRGCDRWDRPWRRPRPVMVEPEWCAPAPVVVLPPRRWRRPHLGIRLVLVP